MKLTYYNAGRQRCRDTTSSPTMKTPRDVMAKAASVLFGVLEMDVTDHMLMKTRRAVELQQRGWTIRRIKEHLKIKPRPTAR